MAVLYELADHYNQVIDLADELDEQTLTDTLDAIQEAFDEKAENIAKAVKEIEGRAEMLKAEKDRLAKRERTMRKTIASMKGYLQEQMMRIGTRKVQGEVVTVALQKNAPSVRVLNEQAIPKEFFIEQPALLNKTQLKIELKNGLLLPEAAELIQTESVRIR